MVGVRSDLTRLTVGVLAVSAGEKDRNMHRLGYDQRLGQPETSRDRVLARPYVTEEGLLQLSAWSKGQAGQVKQREMLLKTAV